MQDKITTDQRFDKIDTQLSDIHEQLDKIATAIVKGFDRLDTSLDDKASKADMQRVYDLLDKIIKQQEIDNDERLVMGHQLDRLDRWVHEVADKIGYKLTV